MITRRPVARKLNIQDFNSEERPLLLYTDSINQASTPITPALDQIRMRAATEETIILEERAMEPNKHSTRIAALTRQVRGARRKIGEYTKDDVKLIDRHTLNGILQGLRVAQAAVTERWP